MSKAKKLAQKQVAAQLVLTRKMIFRSLALDDLRQTPRQILEKSQKLLEFEVTQSAEFEIEWEVVEGPAVSALFNTHSRPKVAAVRALFNTKPVPSLKDVVALFDKNFYEGVDAAITLFTESPEPACDDVIAMFHKKPWPGVDDVQRERERITGRQWPPAFKTNAEWEFHHDTIMMLHEDPQIRSAGKIQAIMSHYPYNFMPKERVYNDKIKYWKVRPGGAVLPSSFRPHYAALKLHHRLSDDSGIDVRSLASSGQDCRQSTITTTSTLSDSSQSERSTGTRDQKVPQPQCSLESLLETIVETRDQEVPEYRHPLVSQCETITEPMEDIADEDLPGHTIINSYNPRDGELVIAANLVKYITMEYIKLEERDAMGDSLLHTAATHGLPQVVTALLSRGADPNSVNRQGRKIWFSTALAFQSVEDELSTDQLAKELEVQLQHQHGKLTDCLELLERASGFKSPQFSLPTRLNSPGKGKEKDNSSHFST